MESNLNFRTIVTIKSILKTEKKIKNKIKKNKNQSIKEIIATLVQKHCSINADKYRSKNIKLRLKKTSRIVGDYLISQSISVNS